MNFSRIINKLALTIFSVLFFTSALLSEEVVVKDDQFTKSKVVTLDTWHKVKEGQLDNTRILYEKEIVNGKESAPVAKFEFKITDYFMQGNTGDPLDPIAFVLIGDESFKVNLADRQMKNQDQIHGSGNTNAIGQYGASVHNYKITILKCNIIFTQEMINKIAKADKLKVRVSTNNTPTVMEATSKQLKLVKEFFASKGEIKKKRSWGDDE